MKIRWEHSRIALKDDFTFMNYYQSVNLCLLYIIV